jgi:cation diffusion facilitator family transporter
MSLQQGASVTLLGLLVNGLLAIGKLAAGIVGHSYALIADAVESASDILSSAIIYSGLKVADQPADTDHPYGHGRAETLASATVSLLLIAAAMGIFWQAVSTLGRPRQSPELWVLLVLLGVVIVKEGLFRLMTGVGKQTGSQAVTVDAWHHRSDAITSLSAAIGVLIAWLGGPKWVAADNVAAMAASLFIAWNGWRLLQPPLHDLMDGSPAPALLKEIRDVTGRCEGVRDVEKIWVRTMGVKRIVDLHIEVDPEVSVREGHRIAHEVKRRLQLEVKGVSDVLVHVEPHETVAR